MGARGPWLTEPGPALPVNEEELRMALRRPTFELRPAGERGFVKEANPQICVHTGLHIAECGCDSSARRAIRKSPLEPRHGGAADLG